MTTSGDAAELTVLGQTVRHPIDHVECFPAPGHVTTVRFTTDEVMSLCPITNQPDISRLVIEYAPDRSCVESKSLKLYLWSFRDRPVFCEALAAEIAGEIMRAAAPHEVRVTVTQHPRGGIVVEAVSERRRDDADPNRSVSRSAAHPTPGRGADAAGDGT